MVLGGCGYDVLSSDAGSEPRRFFHHLLAEGRAAFDLFDVHLHGRPADVPSYVDDVRKMMREHGYEKEVVAGEYGGPVLFEFPELAPILRRTMTAAFAEPATQSVDGLKERQGGDSPERRAMRGLCERAAELPDRLRMFLQGCPPELAARRDRIGCRQVVTRNLLALAAGIEQLRGGTVTSSTSNAWAGRRSSSSETTATPSPARTNHRSRSASRGPRPRLARWTRSARRTRSR